MRQSGILRLVCLLCACNAPDVVIGTRGDNTRRSTGDAATGLLEPSVGELTTVPGAAAVGGDDAGSQSLQRSAGCEKPAAEDDLHVQLGGLSGSYLIDLPSGYDASKPYPLLLALRAAEGSAADFRASLNMASAVEASAIIVHPECPNGRSIWDVPGDVEYLSALRSQLMERHCVDPARVFVLGYAQGGWLASAAACAHSDLLRGVALFAGTEATQPCRGALAMFVAQGTRDPIFSLRAGRRTRDFWADVNHCDTTMGRAAEPSPCEDYACVDAPTRYCEYEGAHELPGFAASSAWSFFRALR